MANPLILLGTQPLPAPAPRPTDHKIVSATVSRIDAGNVFVTVREFSGVYNFGPLETPEGWQPVVGDACLVAFDQNNVGHVVPGWDGGALEADIASLQAKASALEVETVALEAAVADSGWTEPALEHSWKVYGSGYPPAAYRKQGVVVRLRGLVVGGADGTTLFVLPEKDRPAYETNLVGFCSVGGTPTACYVRVLPTGGVAIFYAGSPEYFSVDGLTFTTN